MKWQSATAKRAAFALVALFCLALAGATGFLVRDFMAGNPGTAASGASAIAESQSVTKVNGVTTIIVDTPTQERSGIVTQQLDAAQYRKETTTTAVVLDLQPLIDLRARYDAALSERSATAAAADAARRDFERNKILYADDKNVSLKVYQAADASYRAERSRADAAARAANDLRSAFRIQFGDTLSQWATNPQSPQFRRLLDHREVLLRVSGPVGVAGVDAPRIEVAAVDDRRQPAEYVSATQQADPSIAGTSSIYRTPATPATANGARLMAYLSTPSAASPGVLIPADALIWFGGQPWAYVQTASDRFARILVPTGAPMNHGYFVQHELKPGARVVVRGAQLLLSEELKPRAAGTACKDPECD